MPAIASEVDFSIQRNYFFFIAPLIISAIIFQMIMPMMKVMTISNTAFQKLKGRRTILCSMKCMPITRLIYLWARVGMMPTARDRSRCNPPISTQNQSANFFVLSMG